MSACFRPGRGQSRAAIPWLVCADSSCPEHTRPSSAATVGCPVPDSLSTDSPRAQRVLPGRGPERTRLSSEGQEYTGPSSHGHI